MTLLKIFIFDIFIGASIEIAIVIIVYVFSLTLFER